FILLGHPKPINIYTDHRNLKPILEASVKPVKVQYQKLSRWGLTIQSADIRVTHISSEENAVADQFTRWGSTDDVEVNPDIDQFPAYHSQTFEKQSIGANVKVRASFHTRQQGSGEDISETSSLTFEMQPVVGEKGTDYENQKP